MAFRHVYVFVAWLAAFQASSSGLESCRNESDDTEIESLLQRQILSLVGTEREDRQPTSDRAVRSQVRDLGERCGRGAYATEVGQCPAECPLFVRDLSPQVPASGPESHCTFVCVPATEAACAAYSPLEPIPDEGQGVCRGCQIRGCVTCVDPSPELSAQAMDRCTRCGSGYLLQQDGTCLSQYRYVWYASFGTLGLGAVVIFAWMVDLAMRPITNTAGLEQGLATRSRAKLHTPKKLRAPASSEASGMISAGSCEVAGDAPTVGDIDAPNRNGSSTPSSPTDTPEQSPRTWGGSTGDKESERTLWPLSTNLCRTDVAGPGLVLHFNYLAMMTIWSTVIAVSWVFFAYFVDPSLFVLGLSWASTPRETCAVVAWGFETQHRLISAKVVFVSACYLFSVGLFVLFGVYQRRLYQQLGNRDTTHMDFAVRLKYLPSMSGNEQLEELLVEELEKATGERPVGVSLTWETGGTLREDLMKVIDDQLDTLHDQQKKNRFKSKSVQSGVLTPRWDSLNAVQPSPLRRALLAVEKIILTKVSSHLLNRGHRKDSGLRHASGGARPLSKSSTRSLSLSSRRLAGSGGSLDADEEVERELRTMHSCNTAFAVFHTQQARDRVYSVCQRSGGFTFRGKAVKVRKAFDEPDSVSWTNFHDTHWAWMTGRVCVGVMFGLAALLAWMVVFYLPYAVFFLRFNYGSGQWPGLLEEGAFTVIIVSGNACMYHVCSSIADWVSFRYIEDRELCYMLLYFFACLLMVASHFFLDFKVAFMALAGVNSRTRDGVLLQDLSSSVEKFDTYPMQRDLGWTILCYACPCTFILPFVAEFFGTIILPYKIMTTIVGSQNISGSQADFFLAAPSMNLARYADVTLNCVLATLVFFFPSGLTLAMFGALAFSNSLIYLYDHYRVLRTVPSFRMSTMRNDDWAQTLLAIPCGLLLSCAAYQANCVEGFERFHPPGAMGHCKEGEDVVWKCMLVFLLHVTVHFLVLSLIVPLFDNYENTRVSRTYSDCAQRLAHSWFSVNPVHCLRSKYIYKHCPPWVYSRIGNEHLLPLNPSIGAYFSDKSVVCEDFTSTLMMGEALGEAFKHGTSRRPNSRWSVPRLSVGVSPDTE